jgi:hypothetical protein
VIIQKNDLPKFGYKRTRYEIEKKQNLPIFLVICGDLSLIFDNLEIFFMKNPLHRSKSLFSSQNLIKMHQ